MKKVLFIFIAMIAIFALFAFFSDRDTPSVRTLKYDSAEFGIAFDYPNTYFLEKKNTGSPQRERTTIIITEDTEENRELREGRSGIPREGPVAITVDIFQNVENLDAEEWVLGMSDSNFKLSNDELVSFTLADKEALSYRWSGLYEGNSVVFVHNGRIIMMSVTFFSPSDEIVRVFESILESIRFR